MHDVAPSETGKIYAIASNDGLGETFGIYLDWKVEYQQMLYHRIEYNPRGAGAARSGSRAPRLAHTRSSGC